jgi:uncharacterized protein (DUF1501 family)
MNPTRRDILRLGLGTSALLACGRRVPTFLANSALALAGQPGAAKDRVLVVLELTGGNDGLNTVVPAGDDIYHKSRPRLRLEKKQLHKVADRIGLHPALGSFAKLLDARQLAIVQSVGYPNPNRSHFESMSIWQSARLDSTSDTPGWLARVLDARPVVPGRDAPALHISGSLLPQALAGGERHVPSLEGLDQFRRRLGMPEGAGAAEQRAALDEIAGRPRGESASLLQFVQRTSVLTYASSARLEGILAGRTATANYPENGLAQRLKLIAQLIKAGLSTSLYYTNLGGFDTHSGQAETHANLLREVGGGLKAFLDDVNATAEGPRVLVLIFSEFGRRLAENASAGTDHGTAAPVFLLGQGVKASLHGPYPNLKDLHDGDPKHGIDFRQVYATVLERWLGCTSGKVLMGKFALLPIL